MVALHDLARRLGVARIFYKDEGRRFGLGSFKAVGGTFAVKRVVDAAPGRDVTVTTATDGNHGRAVAWGARMFGCRAVIYLPRSCSAAREKAIASFGAEIVRTGMNYDDSMRLCASDAARAGRIVVSDHSWTSYTAIPADVMQGYTVMAQEALEQMDEPPTHVFVQAGVGGLAASICAHFWERLGAGRPTFIVVEPEGAACVLAAARAGRVTPLETEARTNMAGLECAEASEIAWEILDRGADYFVTVSDDATGPCMRLLAAHDPPIVAGESAIAGLAALNPQHWEQFGIDETTRILLFGTEGATDPEIYRRLIG
jgi:diaminopropionate ammonia-lyase